MIGEYGGRFGAFGWSMRRCGLARRGCAGHGRLSHWRG
jgi:hypothetical protein